MTRLFPDTSPEAEAVLINLLRQAPSWRKFAMVAQLNQTVRTLAISGLRQRYPDAAEPEIRRRLADILLGPELAEKVYGPLRTFEQPGEETRTPPTLSTADERIFG